MARKLKVYTWTAHYNSEALRAELGNKPWHIQCHASVAAHSKAEVGRIVGSNERHLFCLSETGNKPSIEVCLGKPGAIFVRSMHGGDAPFVEYDPSRHGRLG
jgi:hypothetical protein